MKKPNAPRPVKLPYASTVASFYGDQGATQGSSFLGRMFKGGNGGGGSPAGTTAGGPGGAAVVMTQVQAPNPRRR